MREILVISGKGGTGKTSITAAFAHISRNAIICDLDVDAPDLHLILHPTPADTSPFISGCVPQVDPNVCSACGTCEEMCRFGAICVDNDKWAIVDPIRCEGCGVCVHFCPPKAIAFPPKQCGEWSVSSTRFGTMVHAQLYPGEENSGKLVALLRSQAKLLAKKERAQIILSDGPPGIGCPVISALSGTDLAVMVTEPTPSGLHDLQRVVELCTFFDVPPAVIINKADLNMEITQQIRTFCDESGFPVMAELPHDIKFVHALVRGQAITEFSPGATADKIAAVWQRIIKHAELLKAA